MARYAHLLTRVWPRFSRTMHKNVRNVQSFETVAMFIAARTRTVSYRARRPDSLAVRPKIVSKMDQNSVYV